MFCYFLWIIKKCSLLSLSSTVSLFLFQKCTTSRLLIISLCATLHNTYCTFCYWKSHVSGWKSSAACLSSPTCPTCCHVSLRNCIIIEECNSKLTLSHTLEVCCLHVLFYRLSARCAHLVGILWPSFIISVSGREPLFRPLPLTCSAELVVSARSESAHPSIPLQNKEGLLRGCFIKRENTYSSAILFQ